MAGNVYIQDNGRPIGSDNPLPTRDIIENPFNTPYGQNVVSVSETFWHRVAREGRWIFKASPVAGTSVTTSTTQFFTDQSASVVPNWGFRFYPKRAIITCSVDALLAVMIKTGTVNATESNSQYMYQAYIKAYTPLEIQFDGEIWCEGNADRSSGSVGTWCQVQTSTAGALMWGSVMGIEVAANA